MSLDPLAPGTLALAEEFGLSRDEYDLVLEKLGRTPNVTELGIFSVMWSEHCSYKSTRAHLAKFPTKAPHVIYGPGENAGAIDIGEGLAAIFKMESHNHPSFIEPFQGAATGVGGILRDVFTMGARPVAIMNALRFGEPDHPKTRKLVDGVVSGISFYGNCVGVPTVGGETNFDARYNGNILVNVFCLGIAPTGPASSPAPPRARTIPSSMSAPRRAATASTARPWRARSSSKAKTASARPCKSAIPSSKSCSSKRASN